jgi:hypothetical protein
MKHLLMVVLALTMLCFGGNAYGAQFLGGNSLFYTQPAKTIEPGQLTIQMQTRAWASSINGSSMSNVTQALSFNFGFGRHVELGITPIIYQDLNLSGTGDFTYNTPDDLYIRVKFGGYDMNLFNRPLTWGLTVSGRAHAARHTNVYLEPYTGGANELMLSANFSYFRNQLYPFEGASWHFNMEYINHNDAGSADAIDLFSEVTHDLEYALAYRYPKRRWEFYGELHGNFFLNEPDEWAYTRANVMWIQPGLTYKMFAGLAISLGLDVRVFESGADVLLPEDYLAELMPGYNPDFDLSDYSDPLRLELRRRAGINAGLKRPSEDHPEFYSPWRMTLKLAFMPGTSFRHFNAFADVKPESERDWEMRKKVGASNREIIDWLGAEDEGAEFLDLELEKIRADRRKTEQEIEKLKKKMKQEKTNK